MRRIDLVLTATAILIGLVISAALANHGITDATNAKKLQINFVRGYQPCTAPDDSTTGAFVFQACSPPVPNDSVCDGFAPGGTGSLQVFVTGRETSNNGNLRIKGRAFHLQPGCEGQVLCPVLSFRLTTDACGIDPSGCSTVDVNDQQVGFPATSGCCTVTGGVCSFATLLNTQIPGAIFSGKRMSFDLRGCGLKRVTGAPPLGKTLTCGLIVR